MLLGRCLLHCSLGELIAAAFQERVFKSTQVPVNTGCTFQLRSNSSVRIQYSKTVPSGACVRFATLSIESVIHAHNPISVASLHAPLSNTVSNHVQILTLTICCRLDGHLGSILKGYQFRSKLGWYVHHTATRPIPSHHHVASHL